MSILSDVIGTAEAAELLGVKTHHYVVKLAEEGKLTSKTIKGGHLFLKSEVLKLRQERKHLAKSDRRRTA